MGADVHHRSPLGSTVGVDVGGSSVRAVAFDQAGEPGASYREPTPDDPAELPGLIFAAVADVVGANGEVDPATLVSVGIPGQVDAARGLVRHAVNLGIGDIAFPLVSRLHDLGLRRVHIENDVNAAALGVAAALGGAHDSVALLSVGTGIAAGIVLDGQIHRGHRRLAGEIGHIPIDPLGPLCVCGQRGCLETFASGTAVAAALSGPDRSTSALVDARASGDPVAGAAWDGLVDGLAWATQLLIFTIDVELVALGGGAASVGQPLLDAVRDRLTERARRAPVLAAADMAAHLVLAPSSAPVGALGARLAAEQLGI